MKLESSQPIRIGFVGLGWPGEQHAKAVLALPEQATVEAACDSSSERLEAFASKYAPWKRYTRYEEMLADPEVDAIVISLPNFLHYSATISALQSGKHVMCEKPPTMNVPEMEAIRELAASLRLTYAFSRQSRFSSEMIAARRVVEDGQLGRIYFARAERVRSRGIPIGLGGWFVEKAKAGGGAMIDIGVHAIDAAWYLMGCPKPLAVSGQVAANFSQIIPPGMKFDVEDSGYAFIRFEGGIVMHLEVAWATNVTDAVPVSSWTGHEIENTTVYGTGGTLRLSPLTLFTMEGMERRQTPIVPSINGVHFERQMADFLNAIRTGTPPINNVDQAVELMKILMGVYESSERGAEVSL